MPLSTPDNIEETPEAGSETSEGVPKATVADEEMPVGEAVEFAYNQMYSELDHVFEEINDLDGRVEQHEGKLDVCQERVRSVERQTRTLAVGFLQLILEVSDEENAREYREWLLGAGFEESDLPEVEP